MSAELHKYPRPDFQRTNLSWESLNGNWDFIFDDADLGLTQLWQHRGLPSETKASEDSQPVAKTEIRVPFVFQAPASGINDRDAHEILWYERHISDIRTPEQKQAGHRLLLRFGAVDYHAKVWINGQFVGEHIGGHVPFDLDLTDSIRLFDGEEDRKQDGGNRYRLTVRVFDSAYDLAQPRGKQYWEPKPRDIFYTPSSGIWQSVWLEAVPCLRIGDATYGTVLRCADIDGGKLDARVMVLGRKTRENCAVEIEVSLAGVLVRKSGRVEPRRDENFVRFDVDMRLSEQVLSQLPSDLLRSAPISDTKCWKNGLALWSPEHPLLYELRIHLSSSSDSLADEVRTTTGMRSLTWKSGDSTFRLNDQPYFHALLLDQGYWPNTLMTPPSPSALKTDIELSKAMGFNGCRKHQKVEDPYFLYWADRLGFLVWGEMANTYSFTIESASRLEDEWMAMVRRDINHPSIVAWTPVNESWGYPNLQDQVRQRDHLRSLYHMTKALDPSRPINDNCGWEHVVTDLSTFHDYADAPGMGERCDSVETILGRGKGMFLRSIRGPGGDVRDEGSKHKRGAPILCTEFGGVNIAAKPDHGREENWGYTTAKDSEDLLRRVENIIMATVGNGHVCGIVWTQLTDIEQEQNGLYTYDRKEKLPASKLKAIIRKAAGAYLTFQK